MAKRQSNLELSAIDERDKQLNKNRNYNKKNPYNDAHIRAKSNPEEPLGKGVENSDHQEYVPKLVNKDSFKSQYMRGSINTSKGGGLYDIYGRNDIGGRNRLLEINIYSEGDGEYGKIDIPVDIEGQYIIND